MGGAERLQSVYTTANWNSPLACGAYAKPGNQAWLSAISRRRADYSTSTLATNTVLHTGITSGCVTCHGAPSASAPFSTITFTPKSAVLAPYTSRPHHAV